MPSDASFVADSRFHLTESLVVKLCHKGCITVRLHEGQCSGGYDEH